MPRETEIIEGIEGNESETSSQSYSARLWGQAGRVFNAITQQAQSTTLPVYHYVTDWLFGSPITSEQNFIQRLRQAKDAVANTRDGYITFELKEVHGKTVLGIVDEEGVVQVLEEPWEQRLAQYLESIKAKIQYVEHGELSGTWSETDFTEFKDELVEEGLIRENPEELDLNDVEINKHLLFSGEDKDLKLDLYLKWVNRYGRPASKSEETAQQDESHLGRNLLIGGLAISGAVFNGQLRRGVEQILTKVSFGDHNHGITCSSGLVLSGLSALVSDHFSSASPALLGLSALWCASPVSSQAVWQSPVALYSLNGVIGSELDGEVAVDFSGLSVSQAGDINDDKIGDIIIGAPAASPAGRTNAGRSYVVFGHSGSWNSWNSPFQLATLNGANGFALDGATGDYSGWSVSQAGDINGDNIDDIVIGAPQAVYWGSAWGTTVGRSYVVFGHGGSWNSTFDLTMLNGVNGFELDGATGDSSGASVSRAGDINGDKVDDIIIGAPYASPAGRTNAGRSYVVFGHGGSWSSIFNLTTLNGVDGFRLDGEVAGDFSGTSVSRAGDVNGDNIDDIVIGAPQNSILSGYWSQEPAGRSYVVFGHSSSWGSIFNLTMLNGLNGFQLEGAAGDSSGTSVNRQQFSVN